MPKWGAGEVYEQTLPADMNLEGQARPGASLTKGQILWLRGITRLQTQVDISSVLPFVFFCSSISLASLMHKDDFLSEIYYSEHMSINLFTYLSHTLTISISLSRRY
jgi:hypothetical protein